MGTLYFKLLPIKLLEIIDKHVKYGKHVFQNSNRNLLEEEIFHWHCNKNFDKIVLPHIKRNNTKGYPRPLDLELLAVVLGLIWTKDNGTIGLDLRFKFICIELGLTTEGIQFLILEIKFITNHYY